MEKFHGKSVGNLKIEMYDEKGNVFYTQEKKNMIVHDAHAIVGETMANPGKKIKAKEKQTFETTDSNKKVTIKRAEYKTKKMEVEVSGILSVTQVELEKENSEIFDEIKNVSLIANDDIVTIQSIFTDYSVEEGKETKVIFKNPIQSSTYKKIIIEYVVKNNKNISIVPYSEKVKAGTGAFEKEYKRGTDASDSNLTYVINEKNGEITFETDKSNIVVEYEYYLPYGINFMGIGGNLTRHTSGEPFSFPTSAKKHKKMENEYGGARQIIDFYREVKQGENEIKQFQKKTSSPSDSSHLSYTIGLTDGPILSIERIIYKDGTGDTGDEKSYVPDHGGLDTINDRVLIKNANSGEIELKEDLYNEIPNGNFFQLEYKINSGLTVSYIADFPRGVPSLLSSETETFVASAVPANKIITLSKEIKNLKSVKHMNVDTALVYGVDFDLTTNPKEIDLSKYFSSASATIPASEKVLGLEVKANPQIVLPKTLSSETVSVKMTSAGGVGATITLTPITYYSVDLFANVVDLTAYVDSGVTINNDDEFLIEYTASAAVVISPADYFVVEYETENKKVEIYQVGMFTHQNENTQDSTLPDYDETSRMFNISGIGPVIKDENIGMRINWSVTF